MSADSHRRPLVPRGAAPERYDAEVVGAIGVDPWRLAADFVLGTFAEALVEACRSGTLPEILWCCELGRVTREGLFKSGAVGGMTNSSDPANIEWILGHFPPGEATERWLREGYCYAAVVHSESLGVRLWRYSLSGAGCGRGGSPLCGASARGAAGIIRAARSAGKSDWLCQELLRCGCEVNRAWVPAFRSPSAAAGLADRNPRNLHALLSFVCGSGDSAALDAIAGHAAPDYCWADHMLDACKLAGGSMIDWLLARVAPLSPTMAANLVGAASNNASYAPLRVLWARGVVDQWYDTRAKGMHCTWTLHCLSCAVMARDADFYSDVDLGFSAILVELLARGFVNLAEWVLARMDISLDWGDIAQRALRKARWPAARDAADDPTARWITREPQAVVLGWLTAKTRAIPLAQRKIKVHSLPYEAGAYTHDAMCALGAYELVRIFGLSQSQVAQCVEHIGRGCTGCGPAACGHTALLKFAFTWAPARARAFARLAQSRKLGDPKLLAVLCGESADERFVTACALGRVDDCRAAGLTSDEIRAGLGRIGQRLARRFAREQYKAVDTWIQGVFRSAKFGRRASGGGR